MIINIQSNGKILQKKENLYLPDFTVLTGENGSGKTQLLEYLRDNSIFWTGEIDTNGNEVKRDYSIRDDNGRELTDIAFSFPGLKSSEIDLHNENPLINQIKNQWNILMPIAKSYAFISDKTFDDESKELESLNAAIALFVRQLTMNTNLSNNNLKKATVNQLNQLKKLSSQTKKTIENISFIDFLIFYDVPTNIFSSSLDLLFHQFHLKTKYYNDLTKNISPPWEVFNSILKKAEFKYRVEYYPSSNEEFPPSVKFIDNIKGVSNTTLMSLSSGEKTIMALIFVLYHASNNGKFPDVILFDEPDAHLHPSLTKLFINVIEKVLVEEQNVRVILTTHSPSTIALSNEESIYRMDRNLGYPVKENRTKAVQNLSNGLASVTIEEGNLGIEYVLKRTNQNILFTEGITDKIILEMAWKKLFPLVQIPFIIQDCFCASFLSNLFNNGDQKYDGIFEIDRSKKMIALFDFDQAGYNGWNRINFRNIIEKDPFKGLTKSNGKNAYAMLLTVPNIQQIKSQVIKKEKETFRDKSSLTIESLFFNSSNFKTRYFSEEILPGGGFSYQFRGDKREFAKGIENLSKDDFVEFIPLFNKIQDIFNKEN